MNSDDKKESQEKPLELVFHNIHDHGVEIMDMWMNVVETRTSGRVRFTKSSGENQAAIKAADVIRDVPAGGEATVYSISSSILDCRKKTNSLIIVMPQDKIMLSSSNNIFADDEKLEYTDSLL